MTTLTSPSTTASKGPEGVTGRKPNMLARRVGALLLTLVTVAGGADVAYQGVQRFRTGSTYSSNPESIPNDKADTFKAPAGKGPSQLAAELSTHQGDQEALYYEITNQEHNGILSLGQTVRVESNLVDQAPSDVTVINAATEQPVELPVAPK